MYLEIASLSLAMTLKRVLRYGGNNIVTWKVPGCHCEERKRRNNLVHFKKKIK